MPDTMGQRFSCGFPEEWEDFAKRHRLFLERFPNLVAALNTAFIRRATLSEHIDKFISSTEGFVAKISLKSGCAVATGMGLPL